MGGNENVFLPVNEQPFFTVSTTPENTACLDNRDYICTQLWNIDAINRGCTVGAGGVGTDFSGEYSLGFKPECKDTSQDSHCNKFLAKHTDLRDNLILSADLKMER
eukprot:TRINITY_DN9017_c0_g1_i1.p1 TRINITY_DN9017_c0_g1~~TRINITY_DN9017_c0_g1_i1.p1  ORF type:complete len:106 (-),score=20.10 TRINITY_DN9017_c0_g1_i1:64-381(-)